MLRQFSRTMGSSIDNIGSSTLPSSITKAQNSMEYRPFDVYVMSNDNDTNLLTSDMFDYFATLLKHVYLNFTYRVKMDDIAITYRYMPDFCKPDMGCQRIDKS